jgi:integrase
MVSSAERFLADKKRQSLPLTASTRNGTLFTPCDQKWRFREGPNDKSFNFELIPPVFFALTTSIKKTLIWYLENRGLTTTHDLFSRVLWLGRMLAASGYKNIENITEEHLLAVLATSKKSEHNLSSLRPFLLKWHDICAPGLESSAANLLTKKTLKQNPTGVAVATLDPTQGPMTEFEFEDLQIKLNRAASTGAISESKLLMCYLLIALGIRPVQVTSLKCKDFIPALRGGDDHLINMPRAKQQQTLDRTEFKLRKLNKKLGDKLKNYIERISTQYKDQITDTRELPLFPQERTHNFPDSPGFELHSTATATALKIGRTLKSLDLHSERLNRKTPLNSIRLRRTFATRAAEEGWPSLVIAELLDHTDTRHVEIYTGLTSRVRANFSKKIAIDMAPIALAFNGKIIKTENDASRPGISSRIVDLRIDRSGAPLASCGSHAHCKFSRPFACYAGCYDFEPWLDGPHEAALDYMLSRREHLITTADVKIASINDRSILGCAQVMLRCREIKGAINGQDC